MAWESELEKYPDYVHAIGMVSIENSNLEIALADVMAAALFLSRRVAHAIYFTPRAATLRIDIFKAATAEALKPSRRKNPNVSHETQKREALAKIRRLVSNSLSATQRRHDIIHDVWGAFDESSGVYRQKIGRLLEKTAEHVDLNTLNVLIKDFRSLIDEAHALYWGFKDRPPMLVDLRL